MYPALVCSASLVCPVPRRAVIDMWITACGGGNKSSTRACYPASSHSLLAGPERTAATIWRSKLKWQANCYRAADFSQDFFLFLNKKNLVALPDLSSLKFILPFPPPTFLLFFPLTTSRYLKPLIYQGNLKTIPLFFGMTSIFFKKGWTQKDRRHALMHKIKCVTERCLVYM